MSPVTLVPSSPVTVNDLILAENTVTVTGSFGGMSTLPNLGFELTLTLLFSASEVLSGAAEASRPDTVTAGAAVDVTVTTTSSCEPPHPARTSRNVVNRAIRAAVRPRIPPMGVRRTVTFPFRRTGQFSSDAQVNSRQTHRSIHVRRTVLSVCHHRRP